MADPVAIARDLGDLAPCADRTAHPLREAVHDLLVPPLDRIVEVQLMQVAFGLNADR